MGERSETRPAIRSRAVLWRCPDGLVLGGICGRLWPLATTPPPPPPVFKRFRHCVKPADVFKREVILMPFGLILDMEYAYG